MTSRTEQTQRRARDLIAPVARVWNRLLEVEWLWIATLPGGRARRSVSDRAGIAGNSGGDRAAGVGREPRSVVAGPRHHPREEGTGARRGPERLRLRARHGARPRRRADAALRGRPFDAGGRGQSRQRRRARRPARELAAQGDPAAAGSAAAAPVRARPRGAPQGRHQSDPAAGRGREQGRAAGEPRPRHHAARPGASAGDAAARPLPLPGLSPGGARGDRGREPALARLRPERARVAAGAAARQRLAQPARQPQRDAGAPRGGGRRYSRRLPAHPRRPGDRAQGRRDRRGRGALHQRDAGRQGSLLIPVAGSGSAPAAGARRGDVVDCAAARAVRRRGEPRAHLLLRGGRAVVEPALSALLGVARRGARWVLPVGAVQLAAALPLRHPLRLGGAGGLPPLRPQRGV